MTGTRTLDVRVYPIDDPQGSTLAFASAALDGVAAIRGIRVVNSDKGAFVSMPQSKDKEGKYHDIAFPLNGELRKAINTDVLEEYKYQANLDPLQRGYEKQNADSVRDMEGVALDVKVFPIKNPQGSTLAFASVTFNVDGEDMMAINSIRVVDSRNGPFVSMPQSKDKEGGFHDVAFPLIGDLRKEMNKAVLAEYGKAKTAERSDRRKGIGDRLADGAAKSARQTPTKPDAAKTRAPAID